MGLSVSYPLVSEPESYVDPDFDEESDLMDFGKDLHEMALTYCYDLIEHRIRSMKEEAKFQKFSHSWGTAVENFKKKYPEWTSDDLLHLKHQFEFFDQYGDKLLNYEEFSKAMDLMNSDDSEEERRAIFDRADVSQYNTINFEEYLQLMYDIKKGVPICSLPGKDKEEQDLEEVINEVSQLDPFRQMCYGVF